MTTAGVEPLAAGGASGAREVLIVFALALLGLVLAAAAALTPWYQASAGSDVAPVVEVDFPDRSAAQR